jgi:hypothetical protein
MSMYKALGVAVLLVTTLAFMSGSKSVGSSPPTLTAPIIVASGKVLNQTVPYSATIFTPGESGLFRLSAYATLTTSTPNSFSNWLYGFTWTDSTGTVQGVTALGSQDYAKGQFWDMAASGTNVTYMGGPSITFQANKGTPITQSVSFSGTPDGTAYSLFYVLERIE